MACASDPAFMLFFPVSEDNSQTISYVLEGNDDYDINTNILGLYRTMINSWKSSDRYLSGIIMDSSYDKESKEEVLLIRLALANQNGDIDSLVRVNFLHAVLIAAMEKVDIIISDDLIEQMLPPDFPEDISDSIFNEEDMYDYEDDKIVNKSQMNLRQKGKEEFSSPEDQNIVDIARKIMSGKIKDKESDKDVESESEGDNE